MSEESLRERTLTRKDCKRMLLTLLQSAPVERDRFVSHLYQSRREYRRTRETAGKSGKQIERCVISTFQIAESMGFKGEFRQLEDVLRIGDCSPFTSRSSDWSRIRSQLMRRQFGCSHTPRCSKPTAKPYLVKST